MHSNFGANDVVVTAYLGGNFDSRKYLVKRTLSNLNAIGLILGIILIGKVSYSTHKSEKVHYLIKRMYCKLNLSNPKYVDRVLQFGFGRRVLHPIHKLELCPEL